MVSVKPEVRSPLNCPPNLPDYVYDIRFPLLMRLAVGVLLVQFLLRCAYALRFCAFSRLSPRPAFAPGGASHFVFMVFYTHSRSAGDYVARDSPGPRRWRPLENGSAKVSAVSCLSPLSASAQICLFYVQLRYSVIVLAPLTAQAHDAAAAAGAAHCDRECYL
ncbi:hypothetical protein EVAR_46562_1 [Eumeta japonica]|uniref:Uncharacterized protein n=1 Tax=Eumeta variegata TaxID=151549 RepID=A0A4C1XNK3_EUMVA|nr:hypothetical protein EVAR_46562_1 [Eumeta japonica]